jgi:hypothetical protein
MPPTNVSPFAFLGDLSLDTAPTHINAGGTGAYAIPAQHQEKTSSAPQRVSNTKVVRGIQSAPRDTWKSSQYSSNQARTSATLHVDEMDFGFDIYDMGRYFEDTQHRRPDVDPERVERNRQKREAKRERYAGNREESRRAAVEKRKSARARPKVERKGCSKFH